MSTTETTTETTETIHPQRKQRRWLWPVATAAALFIGIGIGGAGSGGEPAEPEVRTETVTETETVEVAVVPAECLAALDDADVLNGLSAEFADITSYALGLASEALLAAATFDVAEVERISVEMEGVPDQINDITAQVQGSTYAVNRDACRAAG